MNGFQEASHELKSQVWFKATPIPNYDDKVWRRDRFGSAIKFGEHGNRDSEFGWEIDHIVPVAKGGTDHISNLQPLQWENNVHKGAS